MIKHGVICGQQNETIDESVIWFEFQAEHLNSGSLLPVMLQKKKKQEMALNRPAPSQPRDNIERSTLVTTPTGYYLLPTTNQNHNKPWQNLETDPT